MPITGERKRAADRRRAIEGSRGRTLYRLAMFWRKHRTPEMMTLVTGLLSEWLAEDARAGLPAPTWPETEVRRAQAKTLRRDLR